MTSRWLMDEIRRDYVTTGQYRQTPMGFILARSLLQRGYGEDQTYDRFEWVEDELVPIKSEESDDGTE